MDDTAESEADGPQQNRSWIVEWGVILALLILAFAVYTGQRSVSSRADAVVCTVGVLADGIEQANAATAEANALLRAQAPTLEAARALIAAETAEEEAEAIRLLRETPPVSVPEPTGVDPVEIPGDVADCGP